MKFLDALKAAFDSLVRTFSPMIIGAALGWLAVVFGPVPIPEEVAQLVTLLVALAFQMLWYGILRVTELVRGKASALLGLGIVKSEPVYHLTKTFDADGNVTWMTRAQYRASLTTDSDNSSKPGEGDA